MLKSTLNKTILFLLFSAQHAYVHGQMLTVTQAEHINSTSLSATYDSRSITSTNPTSSGSFTHGNPGGNDPGDASETVNSSITASYDGMGFFSAKSQVSGNALYGSSSGGGQITASSSTTSSFTLSGSFQYTINTGLSFTNSGAVKLSDQFITLKDGNGFVIFSVVTPGTFQKSGVLSPGNYSLSAQTGFSASSGSNADDSVYYALQLTTVPEPAATAWLTLGSILAAAGYFRRRAGLNVAVRVTPVGSGNTNRRQRN